jgi:predicted TIM-barrel fold metal-dependent hydrolase
MPRIIDADTHFLEPDTVYLDHVPAACRELALRVERDPLGWPWLVHRARRLARIDTHVPGRVDFVGEQRRRFAAGERCPEPPAAIPDPWEPAARIRNLAAQGVAASIVFPNLGLLWEDELKDDLPSLSANMEAYNTWLLELLPECRDRLYPAALLHLRDLEWFERELARCARAGIRLAMIGAQQVGGRALAHPDFERAWAALEAHGVAACFHVASIELPLHPAWYALDPQPGNKLMDTAFLYLPAAVALANLIVHGVLERHPGLRIGVTELSAGWVPGFLLHLDGAFAFYTAQTGAPLSRLSLRPSDYFRRQVRVNAFPLEAPASLIPLAGNLFTWGSDYPHAEGMRRPSWDDYQRAQPRPLSEAERAALSGGNAAFLIGEPG